MKRNEKKKTCTKQITSKDAIDDITSAKILTNLKKNKRVPALLLTAIPFSVGIEGIDIMSPSFF